MWRKVGTGIAGLAMIVALSGCGGGDVDSAPSPTVTVDPTEAAIRDAKAATLHYVDVMQDLDVSDPDALESFYSLSTGNQSEIDRTFYDDLHERGWGVRGTIALTLMEVTEVATVSSVPLALCIDSSDYEVLNDKGEVQELTRDPIQPIRIQLERAEGDKWLVSSVKSREGEPTCQ